MANMYINAMTALWNSVGTTYSAIKMNVTDAGSASGSNLLHLQVSSVDKFTVNKSGAVFSAGAFTVTGGTISGASNLPLVNDGAALGSSSFAWSDLFLASGGVINFAAGDVTVTHADNSLAFAGASGGYRFDSTVKLAANDVGSLGVSGTAWSDLFLASGAVINFAAGDVTITHAANSLAFAGASTSYTFDARMATVGAVIPTNSRAGLTTTGDVVLAGGYQFMMNSYWDTVALAYKAATVGFGGSLQFQPGSGAISFLVSTASAAANAALTMVSPMTLTAAGELAIEGSVAADAGHFVGSPTFAVLASSGAGTVYLRPNGKSSSVGQATIDASGNLVTAGNITGDTITSMVATLATRAVGTGNAHLYFQNSAGAERCLIYANNASDLTIRTGATAVNFQLLANGQFKALNGAVFAAGAYMNTDGNVSGSVWGNWGYGDAYTAIGARIEDRALAWANNRVSSMDYRKVSKGNTYNGVTTEGEQNAPAGAVITGYWRGGGARHEVAYLCYHYLQVYDPVRGWVGFDG